MVIVVRDQLLVKTLVNCRLLVVKGSVAGEVLGDLLVIVVRDQLLVKIFVNCRLLVVKGSVVGEALLDTSGHCGIV